MNELTFEIESLEERIAPCCCGGSLVYAEVSPQVTVNGDNNNVETANIEDNETGNVEIDNSTIDNSIINGQPA